MKKSLAGAAALSITGAILANTYLQSDCFSIEDVKKLQQKGRILISYKGDIYDATDFTESHPGGPGFIAKADGHDIGSVWTDPLFSFHLENELVKKSLQEMRIGKIKDALPSIAMKHGQYPKI